MDVHEKVTSTLEAMQELHEILCHLRQVNLYDMGVEDTKMTLDWLYARLNTALIEQTTLVSLLVEKGVFTDDEYFDKLSDAYREKIEK